MQTNLPFGQTADLKTIQNRLRAVFRPEPAGPRKPPLFQFIRSFIGSRTYDWQSDRAFTRLINRFPKPEALADAEVDEIMPLLAGVTFSDEKAENLRNALRQIRARAGSLDLEFLGGLDVAIALRWLEQIHGAGRKVATATLNFSTLKKRAFVADSHIIRIMRRFGFVRANATTEDVYDAVMASADGMNAKDLYQLHWHLKKLAQTTCKHANALCRLCPLADICMKRIESDPLRRAA
jgi:endonuclease III